MFSTQSHHNAYIPSMRAFFINYGEAILTRADKLKGAVVQGNLDEIFKALKKLARQGDEEAQNLAAEITEWEKESVPVFYYDDEEEGRLSF